jgi:DNA mismatch repair protein MutL
MPICILSPDVASKIAAGEVVERPASVVKELVENSLDARATRIAIEVQGGGVRLIRVVDNGAGIPPEEVDLAFERFATSKVATVDDLAGISSLGFRGEALPSVAAVSEVTMVTRSKDELSGIFVNIKDGAVLEKAKRGCPIGTTVTVRNLFRNVPARLKFLKSTATENGHIGNLVTQYSLAFPEVRFTLIVDAKTTFRSAGSGNLREVLSAVYGLDVGKAMLQIEPKENQDVLLPGITGFTSPISLTRASRSYLSFFVNRRWVQNRMLTFALEEAYKGLLMVGRHPIAVINIWLPPQDIDVNVHPAKSEVRFRNERDVFTAIRKAVRDTLAIQASMPTLDTLSRQPLQVSSAERTFAFDAKSEESVVKAPLATPPPAEPVAKSLPILRVVGQMSNTYIIAEGPDGMYLIDQHAAHERVLFEKIRNERTRRAIEIQGLLQPLTVELTVRQQELMESQSEALSEYGFGIEHFGERTYLVRSVPALLKGHNVAQSLVEVLDFLAEGEKGDRREEIAVSLACHGAVRAGQALSHEEMRDLIRQLEQASQPRTCPHGRPTMIHLSSLQLEKGFGRR